MISWKWILERVTLVLLAVVAGAAATECIFRWYLASPTVPRDEREFERIVSAGWPRPIAREKDGDTIRILGLADSFGVAGGEENFHYLLERSLRSSGYPVEIVNFSVGGYSLADEHRLLSRFGPGFEPDVILHSFFVGNDFRIPDGENRIYRGLSVPVTPGWRTALPSNWLLPRWLGRYRRAVAVEERGRQDRREGAEAGTFPREEFLWIEAVRLSTFRRPSAESIIAWPDVTRALDLIHSTGEETGAQTVLIVHPAQVQVEPVVLQEVLAASQQDREAYDMDLPLRYLATYAGSRDIPIIELAPAFRRRGRDGGLYLPLDTHYNEAGNRLAAEVIRDALEPMLQEMMATSK